MFQWSNHVPIMFQPGTVPDSARRLDPPAALGGFLWPPPGPSRSPAARCPRRAPRAPWNGSRSLGRMDVDDLDDLDDVDDLDVDDVDFVDDMEMFGS